MPPRGVSAHEILVRQILFPPLINGIKTPHWGKEIVSVGGGLKKGWKEGRYILRHRDLALLKI